MRAVRLLDQYLGLSGTNLTRWEDVLEESGLCNVGAGRFLSPHKSSLAVLDLLRLARFLTSIRSAATERQIFHLWWHPYNFGSHTDENIAFLENILEAFARFRESHGMRSLTMADVGEIVKGRTQASKRKPSAAIIGCKT